MYQHQIYIGTNVTPAFLFYIKCPEAFVSLERGRVSEGTFQYKHHRWGREGPGQLHCTVSGPGGWSRGIRLLLYKAGTCQCQQLLGCST